MKEQEYVYTIVECTELDTQELELIERDEMFEYVHDARDKIQELHVKDPNDKVTRLIRVKKRFSTYETI